MLDQPLREEIARIIHGGRPAPALIVLDPPAACVSMVHDPPAGPAVTIQSGMHNRRVDDNARSSLAIDGRLCVCSHRQSDSEVIKRRSVL